MLRPRLFYKIGFLAGLFTLGLVQLCACSGGGANPASATAQADTAPAKSFTVPAAALPGAGDSAVLSTPQQSTSASSTPLPGIQPASGFPVPITLHYILPSGITAVSLASRALQIQSLHHLQTASGYTGYTSPLTQPISMSLNVTPLGGSTTNVTSTSCTPLGSGTSGSCTITFTAAQGPTTLAGTLSAGSGVIASFSQVTVIQPNTINTLNFTSNPVVSSVALQLATSSINSGTPSNTLLIVQAKDINGNIIAGTAPYVDSSGNSVAFLVNVTNTQNGGRGTVSIQGPQRIITPSQAATYAHYDGNWLDHATINLTSTSNLISSPANATLNTLGSHTTYTPGLASYGLSAGPDGNVWYDGGAADCVGKITPSGSYTNYCTGISSGAFTFGITRGPDGNMWFAERSNNKIGRITPNGQVTEFSGPPGSPGGLCAGPDGNMWFTVPTASSIYRMKINGNSVSAFTGLTGNAVGGKLSSIAAGSDDNLWFTESSPAQIGRINVYGTNLKEFSSGLPGNASLGAIIQGPDGNMWFFDNGPTPSAVGRITLDGNITEFPLILGGALRDMTVGIDGNIWVTEASSRIARVTTSGVVTEFSDFSYGLTTGPDGNLWTTQGGSSPNILKWTL